MRKKIRRRALYGIAAVIMAATAIGGVAAKETQPYKAPELRLVKGSQEYDLLEGITYNKSKYQLMVEDTGDFDIDVLGKYIVEYSLTPLEDGEEVTTPASGTGTTGGSHSGGSGGGASGGHTSAPSESNSNDTETKGEDPKADQEKETERETEVPDKDNTADEDHRQDENGGSDQDKNNGSENAGDDKESENDKDTSNGSGKEDNSGAGLDDASGENKSDDQSENSSGSGSDTDQDASDSENAGDSNSGTGNDGSDADQNTSDEMMSVSSNNKKESLFVRLAAKFTGHVYAAETETKEVKEEESKKETKVEQTKETKETEDIKETTTENQKTDQKENETAQETETADDPTAESTVPAETETETETAKAEETKESIDQTEEGKLDENDTVIYFNRIVRVVAAEGELTIEYDEPNLQIPSNADLFTLIEEKEVDLIEPEKDETGKQNEDIPHEETTNSQEKTEDTEKTGLLDKIKHVLFGEEKNTDTELEENQDAENSEKENAAEEIPETDVIQDEDMIQDTDEDMEYELVMKNPEMILDDVVLADAEGNKIRNAKITIKNDEELKDAVRVETSANGVPYIAGIEEGIYTIEISAIDLETEEEIICERDIEVIPSEQIYFDAPDLYIGTKNTSYDLLAGMVATDEKGEEVKALYVINDQELAKVKIDTEDEDAQEETATASNAEAPTTHLKKGIYRVVIGAKHPVSGEEFTVTRKVYIIDGYYIYAPTLEIEAGATFYNLLDGVELRNANDGSRKEDAKITVTDMTDLLRGSETEEEWLDEEDPVQEETIAETGFSTYSLEPTEVTEAVAAEETTVDANVKESEHAESVNEETVNTGSEFMPPVKAGTYQVKLSATDPETGETITVFRTVKAKASAYVAVQADHEYAMTAELNAYKDKAPGLTTMDIDKIVDTAELNDMESGIGWYVSAAVSGNHVIDLPVPSVPEGYDRKITYRQRDEAEFLVNKGIDIANITTYHYSDYKDRSLAGLLGFGIKDIYVATGRGTEWGTINGYFGLETSVFRTGVMKQEATEYISELNNQKEVWYQYDKADNPLGPYNKMKGYQNIWNKDGKTTYTGYALTKAMKSNFNPEDGNIADLNHPFASADWANVGATDDTREKWDHDAMDTLFGYKKNDPKTMKDGFPADITITANKDLTNENLNFQTLYSTYHKSEVTKNMTKNSSVEVNGKGHNLTGSTITVNGLQVALNDFNKIENPFILRNFGYLRLKDIKGNNTINVSAYSDDEKKNGSLLDIAGGTTKPITVKNIPNVRITAGEQDMGPVRIWGDYAETGDDAYAANHVLDTNGKTIYVYRVDTAGHTLGKTVLKGDGIIKMMDTQDGESNAQYGNMLRLKDVVLEGDVTIQKSAYAPDGNRKGATAMTVSGQNGLVAYNHKIKLMMSTAGLEDGEVLVGQGTGTGMESTSILDVNDFELVSPKEGERYNGKYYYLSLENGGKTIVAKATDTMPIVVSPAVPGTYSTDGYYLTYEQAMYDIREYGKGTDYVITNKREREFSEKAAQYLSEITSKKATSLTFQSADRGKTDDQQANRFMVKVSTRTLNMPAGVNVTFKNMALRYDDEQHNGLIFYANGSHLTFDENCVFFGRTAFDEVKDSWKCEYANPTVYGGAENGDNDRETNITVKSGKFKTIYGGNKNGLQNGKTTINIVQTDPTKIAKNNEEGLFIGSINGAGENDQEKPTAKKVVINVTGPAYKETQQAAGGDDKKNNQTQGGLDAFSINNLYDFDQLYVNGQVMLGADLGEDKGSTEVDSGKIDGYEGEVIVGDGAIFGFADPKGYKKIGSLHRVEGGDASKTTRVVLTRVNDYTEKDGNVYDATKIQNPYNLILTGKDPLHLASGHMAQLDFQYNTLVKGGLGAENDVVMHFTGISEGEKSKYIRISTIISNFRTADATAGTGWKWANVRADVTDSAIRIGNPEFAVLVFSGDPKTGVNATGFTRNIFSTVDEALRAIAAHEGQPKYQNGKYIISIFKEGYHLSEVDFAELDNPGVLTASQLFWTSRYSPYAGTTEKPNNIILDKAATIYVDDDWTFYGKKNVLDSITLKYEAKHAIYANGTEFLVGFTPAPSGKTAENVQIIADNEDHLPDLFGGGTKPVENTSLDISSGKFANIYGGGDGKEGKVTGNTKVVLHTVAMDDKLELGNVYGGGTEDLTVGGTKTVEIARTSIEYNVDNGDGTKTSILVGSEVSLKDLKDFDTLTVGQEDLDSKSRLHVNGVMLSSKTKDGYTGKVNLLASNMDFTERGKENSHIKDFYSKGSNNGLTLFKDANGTSPLELDGTMTQEGEPLILGLTGTGASGDILLQFKEEANAVEEQYKSGVSKFSIGKDGDKIILEGDAVLLRTKKDDSSYDTDVYPSVVKALKALGTKEQDNPGGSYYISIYGSNYNLTRSDYEAMKAAAAKDTKDTDPLAHVKTATSIIWTSEYILVFNETLNTYTVTKTTSYNTIGVNDNLNFAGQSVTLQKIKLKYQTQANIYANGYPLLTDVGFETLADTVQTFPKLYGGGIEAVDTTSLRIKYGRFSAVYGGGYGTAGKVNGDTNITFLGTSNEVVVGMIAGNGSNGAAVAQNGKKAIQIIPDVTDLSSMGGGVYIEWIRLTAENIAEFDELTLGHTAASAAGKISTLTVSNTMRGTFDQYTYTYGGTVKMINAQLKFTGAFNPQWGDLYSEGSSNKLTIPKVGVTYPLTLTGKTELSDPANRIIVETSNTPARGDVVVTYSDEKNADEALFSSSVSTYSVAKEKNKLYLDKSAYWYVKTKNGQEGRITDLSRTQHYDNLINGNFATWNYLYDSADGQWKSKQMLVAKNYANNEYYYTQFYELGDQKGTKTSDAGETFNYYEWSTAKTILPAFAGLKRTFTWGIVPDGLTLSQLNNINNRDKYYFNSNGVQEEPEWKNFGKGEGLYDWDTGEWKDDPDVTLRSLQHDKNITWNADLITYVNKIVNENTGADRNSSLVWDYDEYPTNKDKGSSYSPKNRLGRNAWTWGQFDHLLGIQMAMKNTVFGTKENMQENKSVHYWVLHDNSVFRFDSCYPSFASDIPDHRVPATGYGTPWMFCVYMPNSELETADAVFQIRMSDISNNNPRYSTESGGVPKIHVKLSERQHANSLNHLLARDWIKVETGTTVLKVGDIGNWDNYHAGFLKESAGKLDKVHAKLILSGEGSIWLSYRPVDNHGLMGTMIVDTVELHGNVGIAPCLRLPGNIQFLGGEPVIANGYKIQGSAVDGTGNKNFDQYMSERDLTDGFVYAKTGDTTKGYPRTFLDATDFKLVRPTEGENGYYFVAEDKGTYTQIVVKQILDDNGNPLENKIKVTPGFDNEQESYFKDYATALDAIKHKGTSADAYTIENIIDADFEPDAATVLASMQEDCAKSLTFVSGKRKNGETVGALGDRYEVRLRKQVLMLPENLPVIFEDIAMKYEQGESRELNGEDGKLDTEDIVFINNGYNLTFGQNVSFFKGDLDDSAAIVYGGSVENPEEYGWEKDFAGKTTKEPTVEIASGTFSAVYGGGTKAQGSDGVLGTRVLADPVNANVIITGGTVGNVFGGGSGANGLVKGNTLVRISGGEITGEAVYAGGENADVEGDTSLYVSSAISTTEADATSYYGGSMNGTVTGNSTVQLLAMNNNTDTNFYMNTVSGYGSDEKGALVENSVTGNAVVSLQQNDPENAAFVTHVKVLSGFTDLTLGNTERTSGGGTAPVYDFEKSKVIVTERFDSTPVGNSADITALRRGNVSLYATMLTLDGQWQGHINNLSTTDPCALNVTKKDGAIYPLIVDGTVSLDKTDNMIRLLNSSGDNIAKDRFLTFTTKTNALTDQYIDGTSAGLTTMTEDENTVRHIILEIPTTHIIDYSIAYTPDDAVVLDVEGKQNSPKQIHFEYDPTDQHNLRCGYVVAMPKSYVTDSSISDDTRKLYTTMDTGFLGDPTTLPTLPAGQAYKVTIDPDGTHAVSDQIHIDDSDNGYWYIAHFACETNETFVKLLDVSAPVQDTADVTTAINGRTDKYEFVLTYKDVTENDPTKLPATTQSKGDGTQNNYRLPYNGSGITTVYWALGTDQTGTDKVNQAADNAAAKRPEEITNLELDENGNILKGTGTIVNIDGAATVSNGAVGKLTVEVPKDLVDNNTDGILWIYVKDGKNNTRKYGIPLNDKQIDVRVPLKVYVVAMKKEADDKVPESRVPELLAPDCYVVNDGVNTIQAEISGFETHTSAASDKLRLSTKSNADQFANVEDEIALFIRKIKGSTLGSPLPEELLLKNNVKSIDPKDRSTWLDIGVLGPKTENTRTKDFTFDAIYDPQKIVELGEDEWIENTMSYYFTIVNQKQKP